MQIHKKVNWLVRRTFTPSGRASTRKEGGLDLALRNCDFLQGFLKVTPETQKNMSSYVRTAEGGQATFWLSIRPLVKRKKSLRAKFDFLKTVNFSNANLDILETMFYNRDMDDLARLKLLTDQMELEPAEDFRPGCYIPADAYGVPGMKPIPLTRERDFYIHPAQLPNGQTIKLLKTLLTSACERNCYYCPFRAGRDFRRATFSPDEFARVFMELNRRGIAEGTFLSSGVAGGGIRSQDRLIETAEVLRHKYGFRGYIHLKIMPGAEQAQVEHAMRLADRVSINLEAPTNERLARLAPEKVFLEELFRPLQWVEQIRQSQPAHLGWNRRWPSTTTQFVVGGSDENDLELLTTTAWLNSHVNLKRAYFSAFKPVPDTPLENKTATNPLRQHRLYQASFLLRDYGFDLEELPFAGDGNLPLALDPKQAWARENLIERPLEINRAGKQELLRVPGIGLKGAEAILRARKHKSLRDLAMLKKLGVIAERAAPYLLMDGARAPAQGRLF